MFLELSVASFSTNAAADDAHCVGAQGAEFLSNEEIGCIIINEAPIPQPHEV